MVPCLQQHGVRLLVQHREACLPACLKDSHNDFHSFSTPFC